jgi:hypothetical protein
MSEANSEVVVRNRVRPARPLDLEVPEGTIVVRRAAYGQEEETKEVVRVPVFHTAPARIRVVGSVTRNLGDYNSARVEVMIEVPCNPEASEIDRAYKWASEVLDTYIPEQLAAATGSK